MEALPRPRRRRARRHPVKGATAPGGIVAIDVGGTAIKGVACDAQGDVVARRELPTPADPEAAVGAVRATARELVDDLPAVSGCGIVVPAVVDREAGVVQLSVNLGWSDLRLRAILEDDLGVPVALDNDVHAAGVAEARLGAARGDDPALIVPIGAGIGAAIVVDGSVVPGASGFAGEIGHIPVVADGLGCRCGQHGCAEVYASATAIAARYSAAAELPLTAADVAVRAATDPVAASVWADAVDALGRMLAIAVGVLDPAVVVIGGGLSQAGDTLLDPLRLRVATHLALRSAPRIEAATFGAHGGRVGAVMTAWQAAGASELPASFPSAVASP